MKSIQRSRLSQSIALCAFLAAAKHSTADAQYIDYSNTGLIHGFGSGAAMWTTPRPALNGFSPQQYFASRVNLKSVWRPDWKDTVAFATQWQNVRDSIATRSGGHVLVGHSTGGLVARYMYLNGEQSIRDKSRAILTVASPHQGAILADSAAQLGGFAHDLKKKIDAATPHVKYTLAVIATAFGTALAGSSGGTAGFMAVMFRNFPSITNPTELLEVATLSALRTTSPQVNILNNSGNFDADKPRANVIGRMDNNKFMPLKLMAAFRNITEQAQISEFQKARSAFNTCKNVLAFLILGLPSAIVCSDAERIMGRVDETWQRYASGSSPQQVCGQVWDEFGPHQRCWMEQRPRLNLPTDGVVPNERSLYPSRNAGEFLQAEPINANHMTVYRVLEGANRLADAMLVGLRMEPPAPPPAPGLSASISGTSSIASGASCNWGVAVSGGAAPYAFEWSVNGSPAGDGSDSLNYTNTGSAFTIAVLVTDQNGASVPASLYVSIVAGNYCT